MPNKRNEKILEHLRQTFSEAASAIFIDYSKLSSNQINALRSRLSEASAKMLVTKNTLLNIVMGGKGKPAAQEKFEGQTAVIFGLSDPLAPIKVLFEFIKENELPTVKLGLMDGSYIGPDIVKELSKVPSKEELITRILSGFNSPVSGLAKALSVTKINFVRVIDQIAKSKGGAN